MQSKGETISGDVIAVNLHVVSFESIQVRLRALSSVKCRSLLVHTRSTCPLVGRWCHCGMPRAASPCACVRARWSGGQVTEVALTPALARSLQVTGTTDVTVLVLAGAGCGGSGAARSPGAPALLQLYSAYMRAAAPLGALPAVVVCR